MTSEARHCQVSLRGACVSSRSLFFPTRLSPLSTQYNCAIIRTVSNRKSGRVRVTCSEKNDANSAAKDFNQGRIKRGWGAEREGGSRAQRTVTGGCEENCEGYEDSIEGSRKAVMLHKHSWYGGSLNCLLLYFFSQLGCLNVSDNSNTLSITHTNSYTFHRL